MEKKNNPRLSGFGKKSEKSSEKAARKPVPQKAANFAEYEAMMNEKKKAEKKKQKEKKKPVIEKASKKTAKPVKNTKQKQNAKKQSKQNTKKPTSQKQKETAISYAEYASKQREVLETLYRGGKNTPLKIIPIGGLNEIGKNLTVFECGNDMFIVDCGLAFPDTELYGVDIVIPEFTYIEQNIDKLRGIVITHGHEDHIGGLAYLLKKVKVPVYATKLTIGLIEGKLKEHNLSGEVTLNVSRPGQIVKMGCMAVEFIRVNHSIPDACGFAIHTPAGVVVHTGDFKVDYTPIEGGIIDLARFGELGSKGVLALMSDSTNSERAGYTQTERTVGKAFDKLFEDADGKRIIIATFSSNIHRIQQVINCAKKYGRKVAVSGRSMVNVISTAVELGYLDAPDGIIIDIDLINRYSPEQIVIVTTGSQGEPMSALSRMAMNDHKKVSITPMDYIIISATPIPGNEKLVTKVVNELMTLGATVIYESMYDVHVSGHACQDEQKLIMALTRPKFFIPVHGEYKHLKKHAETAVGMGIPEENIIIGSNGNVIETNGEDIKITGQVAAGRVLVDGLGVGDVGSIVLRDRKHLAEDGLIIAVSTVDFENGQILSGPDIISRGFVYVRESEELMSEARNIVVSELEDALMTGNSDRNAIKTKIKDALSGFIYKKTKRSPMILPILQEL